jgi:hypothetical protein
LTTIGKMNGVVRIIKEMVSMQQPSIRRRPAKKAFGPTH